VAWLSFLLLIGFLLVIVPRYAETFESLRVRLSGMLRFLMGLEQTIAYWWWIPPAIMLVTMIACRRSAQSTSLGGVGRILPFWWVPGMRSVVHYSEVSSFTTLLATLIRHEVPLDEAITLSADASGSNSIQRAAGQISAALIRGEQPVVPRHLFPPFVSWLLSRGSSPELLAKNLEEAGERYRRQADSRAEWVCFSFPVVATVCLGGLATIIYVLIVFVPFLDLLKVLVT